MAASTPPTACRGRASWPRPPDSLAAIKCNRHEYLEPKYTQNRMLAHTHTHLSLSLTHTVKIPSHQTAPNTRISQLLFYTRTVLRCSFLTPPPASTFDLTSPGRGHDMRAGGRSERRSVKEVWAGPLPDWAGHDWCFIMKQVNPSSRGIVGKMSLVTPGRAEAESRGRSFQS